MPPKKEAVDNPPHDARQEGHRLLSTGFSSYAGHHPAFSFSARRGAIAGRGGMVDGDNPKKDGDQYAHEGKEGLFCSAPAGEQYARERPPLPGTGSLSPCRILPCPLGRSFHRTPEKWSDPACRVAWKKGASLTITTISIFIYFNMIYSRVLPSPYGTLLFRRCMSEGYRESRGHVAKTAEFERHEPTYGGNSARKIPSPHHPLTAKDCGTTRYWSSKRGRPGTSVCRL